MSMRARHNPRLGSDLARAYLRVYAPQICAFVRHMTVVSEVPFYLQVRFTPEGDLEYGFSWTPDAKFRMRVDRSPFVLPYSARLVELGGDKEWFQPGYWVYCDEYTAHDLAVAMTTVGQDEGRHD